MKPIIQLIVAFSTYTFILTSLFGAGLGLTIKEIVSPIKNIKVVLSLLFSNFVLIPAAAVLLSLLFRADQGLHAGLIIIACCAGAPFLPKLITLAKGEMAHAMSFMMLMIVSTVVFAPLIMPLAIPGLKVGPLSIAGPLVVLMLFPLVLGLTVNLIKPRVAAVLKPAVVLISTINLFVAAVFALMIDYRIIISAYGTGVYNLTFLFTVLALLIGFIFSGPDRSDKISFTLGSGARNIAAALIIAAANFTEPRVTTVVLIGSLVQFVMLVLFAKIYGMIGSSRSS